MATVDAYGDLIYSSEPECQECGSRAIDCDYCDSSSWCPDHDPNPQRGERVESSFSADVVWINSKDNTKSVSEVVKSVEEQIAKNS